MASKFLLLFRNIHLKLLVEYFFNHMILPPTPLARPPYIYVYMEFIFDISIDSSFNFLSCLIAAFAVISPWIFHLIEIIIKQINNIN